MTAVLVGLALGTACRRPTSVENASPHEAGATPAVAAEVPTASPLALYPATRCSECHGSIASDWRASTHARAESSQAYAAMRSKTDGEACDRCHAPLARFDSSSLVAKDAVGCDVCHTIRDVDTPGTFTMHLDDSVKYGPLCDAKGNYFHRVGCSPLHETSELCSACHSLAWTTSSGEKITVQSEFEEWRSSTYAASNVECQSCHMPGSRAAMAVAVGSTKRKGVAHHGFSTADLRRRALSMAVTVRDDGPQLSVRVVLRNARAGHSVPSGLPEHRLVLRAEVNGPAPAGSGQVERVYGRILVDGRGPAPFYSATRVASDNRIRAEETREEAFELDAPSAGSVEVSLSYVIVAPEIAESLGILTDRLELRRLRIPFGAPQKGGHRAHLPRTVSAQP